MTAPPFPLVFGKEGLLGRIETSFLDTTASPSLVELRLENGQQIHIPQYLLTKQADGSLFLPLTCSEVEQGYCSPTAAVENDLVVPVVAEELRVGTRTVETSRVRLHKTLVEHEEVVDPELLRDNVTVVRVPVGRLWEGETPGTRQEGDTLIIPVFEEVLVVEKRLMLTEEIHVRREQSAYHAPQSVTLRRQEVQVERVETPESSQSTDTDPA